MTDEEKQAIEFLKEYQDKPPFIIWKDNMPYNKKIQTQIILNLIEKQKNIIDSIKRILEDEELDYCDTLEEIYHFYEEVVNNDR